MVFPETQSSQGSAHSSESPSTEDVQLPHGLMKVLEGLLQVQRQQLTLQREVEWRYVQQLKQYELQYQQLLSLYQQHVETQERQMEMPPQQPQPAQPASVPEPLFAFYPKYFSGKESSREAKKWLEVAIEDLKSAKIPETDWVFYAKHRLTDDAYRWWKAEENRWVIPATWDVFTFRFKEKYLADKSPVAQTPGPTVAPVSRKRQKTLCSHCGTPGHTLKYCPWFPKQCQNCGSIHHMTKDCPAPRLRKDHQDFPYEKLNPQPLCLPSPGKSLQKTRPKKAEQ